MTKAADVHVGRGFEDGVLQLLNSIREKIRSLADVLDEFLVPALLAIRLKAVSMDHHAWLSKPRSA